jgi:hypothetical protein
VDTCPILSIGFSGSINPIRGPSVTLPPPLLCPRVAFVEGFWDCVPHTGYSLFDPDKKILLVLGATGDNPILYLFLYRYESSQQDIQPTLAAAKGFSTR